MAADKLATMLQWGRDREVAEIGRERWPGLSGLGCFNLNPAVGIGREGSKGL
jgi:hypothetical protein